MTSLPDVDVLVVGAGPSGTTLAVDLARRGHTVRVVDRAEAAFDGSRAKGVQPRTLEVFGDLGVLSDVVEGGDTYPLMGIHLGPLTIPFRMIKNSTPSDAIPHPNTWLIPQSRTVDALHRRLAEAGVEVESGTEFRSLSHHEDHVRVVLHRDGADSAVHARYLVGADGGSSAVRRSQDIMFEGTTDEADRMIIADVDTRGLSRRRWHIWPALGGRFTGACPLPNSEAFQWMIRLRESDEPSLDHDRVVSLIRERVGRSVSLGDIHWTSLFRPNIRLAQRYRQGRVFLVGDAAHVHPPAGAQGLNTGVQDAYNLGWKLAQVLDGAPDELLDSYENERRPIAAHVLGLSSAKYRGIGTLDPKAAKRGDDEKQLLLTYRNGPLCLTSEATTTLHAGDRAPDASLTYADGSPVRLFDLLRGGDFTLITYASSIDRAPGTSRWSATGAGLRVVAVDPVRGVDVPGITGVRDVGGNFATSYGVSRETAFLVRPDGYLAGVTTGDAASMVESARRRMAGGEDEAVRPLGGALS
ncbi:FAD-dependent monooxygenase [Rhodococcus corynebacterioides]|nr:FAD-dependent monooxygenase [Rhodococcus corynebacterioides]